MVKNGIRHNDKKKWPRGQMIKVLPVQCSLYLRLRGAVRNPPINCTTEPGGGGLLVWSGEKRILFAIAISRGVLERKKKPRNRGFAHHLEGVLWVAEH